MSERREFARFLDGVIRAATGREMTSMAVVHGGDTSAAYRVELADGGVLFAKTHPAPPPNFFSTEAWGLSWLGEPGVVDVPAVVAVSDGAEGVPAHLVLEWIEEGRGRAGDEATFGRALAALHAHGAPCFGRPDARTTGSLALPNDPCATWSEFYGSRRLRPLATIARARRSLPDDVVGAVERLAGRLDRFDDGRPPARLHGDLWAGNRLVDRDGRSWLVDPACHGGHAEFDLAMMRLFGGFGAEAFAAYREVAPLTDGWEERIALHQIAPLVVHAIKFGGGYVGAAATAIERYA